jgi:IS5 family transposase
VPPKAITHPTDAKLYHKAIVSLGKLAKENEVDLRQSYVRVSKQWLVKTGRYLHAKQMKRAKKSLKKLKAYLGRIIRDVRRKIDGNDKLKDIFSMALEKANRIWNQKIDIWVYHLGSKTLGYPYKS